MKLTILLASFSRSVHYSNGAIAPCDSPIFCFGDLLREVELARPFGDSKSFVDLPTVKPVEEVVAAFELLDKPVSNNTQLQQFLSENFGELGSDIVQPNQTFATAPDFLEKVKSPVIAGFTNAVIEIWPSLTRQSSEKAVCKGCVSSLLPLNRTFVVAGGRFREPYYWDSFFILEGLLRTKGCYTQIAKNIIENFLDFVERFGFVPNGARVYYLNRSQPPLLTQMVRIYIEHTNDTAILSRALPLLVKEHSFWLNNRTITVEGFQLAAYNVSNNQPRPESYFEDYQTVMNNSFNAVDGNTFPVTPLNSTEQANLYSNLASGAESGWDYTSRWIGDVFDAANGQTFPLRTVQTSNIVPVDLNSILYMNEVTIANFFGNRREARQFTSLANRRRDAMAALMYNTTIGAYFDYNRTSNAQKVYVPTSKTDPTPKILFSPSQFYPLWTGAVPDSIKNNASEVLRMYKPVEDMLDLHNGSVPTSNFETGQQWDEPNAWPPLQYILMQGALSAKPGRQSDSHNQTQAIALRLAQRYVDSTYCTWRSTGGSLPSLNISQLSGANPNSTGEMFEKYNMNSTNAVGGGGEYDVVPGFGWSNGVLIWAVDTFANELTTPDCGQCDAAGMRESRLARGHVWKIIKSVKIAGVKVAEKVKNAGEKVAQHVGSIHIVTGSKPIASLF